MPTYPAISDTPQDAVVLQVALTNEECCRAQQMLRERTHAEWELAEDLRALGRSYDECVKRVSLCIRLDAILEAEKMFGSRSRGS
jgi:hypothetical protein